MGISKGVVTKYVSLAVAARLDWPAIAAMDEASLERRLLPASRPSDIYTPADFGRIHQELRRKGITLALLWEEYCAETADLFSADHTTTPHAGRHEAAQFFTLQLPHATTPQSF